jgi:hypothetical protein
VSKSRLDYTPRDLIRLCYRKYITRVTTLVFNLAVQYKVLKPWTDIEAGGYSAVGTGGGSGTPGGARAEAERRR